MNEMCMKTPKPPSAPAPAPFVPVVEKAPAPTLNDSALNTDGTMKKKKGTSALRIDLAAPTGTSGLNI
jgi:hypothetical protein